MCNKLRPHTLVGLLTPLLPLYKASRIRSYIHFSAQVSPAHDVHFPRYAD